MAKRKVPATERPDFTTHRKNFVKLLNQFSSYGYSRWNVFTDFLELSAIAIANCDQILTPTKVVDEREERYKNTIGKYKKEAQPLFAHMLAELIKEMETYCPKHLTDVLGEMFHDLELHNKWKGQFFTSQSVCDMIGMMNFGDAGAKVAANGFVTVNDPCCGGGALILGAANGMRKAGLNPNKQLLTVANDVDERCVHMCYLQLSLYGLPAIIRRQNTLTQEIFGEPWYTPVFVADGWFLKMCRAFDETAPEPKPPAEKPKPIQLKLF